MSDTFNVAQLPFGFLTDPEKALLLSHVQRKDYQSLDIILAAGEPPQGVFVIEHGRVAESECNTQSGEQLIQQQAAFMHYQAGEYFGSWSVFNGKAIHNFIAVEATLCYLIPTPILLELIDSNSLFADYFQQSLSVKREIIAQHAPNQDMAEFMLARIADSTIREPLIVEEGTSIEEATRLMREHKADCLLAKKGNRYGMVTGTDLLDAVILEHRPLATDVSQIASYRLISIRPDDYLFNALIIMTQQRIERVVVMDSQRQLVGVIELTDVLSQFSSHSHVIGLRVERAQSLDELREASFGLTDLIKGLISTGVKIRFVMELLAALNSRILSKLFDLVVPQEVHPHVCLIVMGSEGRGEQIMKTDQDNGLIYRDGLEWPQMHEVMNTFSQTLISFGFPPCPGNIMVSNPEWVNSTKQWADKLTRWSQSYEGEATMNLAIASDSKPVAGNTALFKVARNTFFRRIQDNDIFFAHFAKASLRFDTPLTFFGRLKDSAGLDIKKAGVFPIVHGVRSIALENKVSETNTFKRLEQLVEKGVLQKELADNLAEALSYFVQVRLQQQIKRYNPDPGEFDKAPNEINIKHLTVLERQLLRDSLSVVKDFKKYLIHRYHLTF
ncbi:MAG: putative nucleotidyltransferase substrate binding domain-containing protein [Pseudomonas sp.]|nr:putative nucleotidyltransferase substrate binding domain-containing protein [Pseudomonas sp.]MDY0415336.1 putative nucleotidyltransferase substrate binding domain-containing protein [Pseudomonas sp.]